MSFKYFLRRHRRPVPLALTSWERERLSRFKEVYRLGSNCIDLKDDLQSCRRLVFLRWRLERSGELDRSALPTCTPK